ncbi:hypothetical protein FWK35_00009972 [Aphis craccivora]|uniref:Uncharacterized protein n=1 Tax=Aphis craccivora TaxID=307492 RepID=A0A6G0YNR8_APHCR|nr:hypothetical protein FWK35_00009972 [Aphis craccivora]
MLIKKNCEKQLFFSYNRTTHKEPCNKFSRFFGHLKFFYRHQKSRKFLKFFIVYKCSKLFIDNTYINIW